MEIQYKIFDSSYKKTVIEDYNYIKISNNLKSSILGAILYTTAGTLTIIDVDLKSHINIAQQNINKESILFLEECNSSLDNFINGINKLNQVNYTTKEIIKGILLFKSLQESWDGYGALPLEIDSANNAIQIINSLDPRSIGKVNDFYPNSHGTISFEWINDFDEKLFLEIGNNSFSFFVKYNNTNPLFFNELKIDNESIRLLSEKIESI